MIQSASFRGVPFAVTNSDMIGGRRLALHQYPGRDTAWAEDMGRSPRRFRLRGFVLDGDLLISGDPIDMQRSSLIEAMEKSGTGTLIHPTLGSIEVAMERGSIGEGLGANSHSEVEFEFVESGEQTYPASSTNSASIAESAAGDLEEAADSAGVDAIGAAFDAVATVSQALSVASSWASAVKSLTVDATALYRVVAEMAGSYGRYNAGANIGVTGSNRSPYAAGTTVAQIVVTASSKRQSAIEAADAFIAAIEVADLSDASDVADAVKAMIDALVAACADPADAIRLLLALIAHQVAGLHTDMTTAISRLVVRMAAAALTRAAAGYQPRSSDDAAARISEIASVLDDLMTQAADLSDDACFSALRACRGAVVMALRNNSATLARLRTFDFAAPLPALVLAQSIYADASRADQLVTQVNPVNPLFMDTRFQALAS